MSLNSVLTKIYNKYGENPGQMLVHTGTIGWILSCAAQVLSIVVNNKISPEVKSYLIPQEIGDGAINILSFYVLTSSIKGLASKMAKTGKMTNKAIKSYLTKHKLNNEIGKFDFDIEKTKNYKDIKDEYISFKNGVDVIASTGGAILSCNIVTPLLRNDYATVKQKQIKQRNTKMYNRENQQFELRNRLSLNDYKNMVSNGNLKI